MSKTDKSAKKPKKKGLPHSFSRDKGSLPSIRDETFQSKFKEYCAVYEVRNIPNIVKYTDIPEKPQKSEYSTVEITSVQSIYFDVKPNEEKSIYFLYCKNTELENGILLAMLKCFNIFNTLVILRIEYCNLDFESIEIIQVILKSNPTINEVSLNGNPNKEQNHFLLIRETNISHLSLRFCGIDENGIKKISNELSEPFTHKLFYLNIASNIFGDEGMKHIVNLLRVNRTLGCLNLADNKLTDEGCIQLVHVLQKFELNHEEIIVRRKINLEYYRKLQLYKPIIVRTIEKVRPTPGKAKTESGKQKRKSKDKTSHSSSTKTKRMSDRSSISSITSKVTIPKEQHPFVQDSVAENMKIFCRGNSSLMHLNISYNKISATVLDSVIEMLHYQKISFENGKGILYLTLEGYDLLHSKLEEISELTQSKFKNVFLFSESVLPGMKRKRSSNSNSRTFI